MTAIQKAEILFGSIMIVYWLGGRLLAWIIIGAWALFIQFGAWLLIIYLLFFAASFVHAGNITTKQSQKMKQFEMTLPQIARPTFNQPTYGNVIPNFARPLPTPESAPSKLPETMCVHESWEGGGNAITHCGRGEGI